MLEPWFPVHANLRSRPVIVRACEALGLKPHAAMGLLVQFWGSASQHLDDGNITAHSDTQLEEWAGWTGKRGAFAAFVRERHTDADGRIREWDDFAGKLRASRKAARDRQAKSRSKSRDVIVTTAAERDLSREQSRDVTEQREKKKESEKENQRTTTPLHSSPRGAFTPDVAVDAKLLAYEHVAAFHRLLEVVPDPETWQCVIRAALDGMQGPVIPADRVGLAIVDYIANGDSQRPNIAHFRGYLRRAAAPPTARPAHVSPSDPDPLAGWAKQKQAELDAARTGATAL